MRTINTVDLFCGAGGATTGLELALKRLGMGHSFPADYKLTGNRGDQVKQIGNSVPVETAAAMCAVDFEERKTA